jgi:hypothetical protein
MNVGQWLVVDCATVLCFCSIDPSKSDISSLLPSWHPTSGRNGRLDFLRNSSLDRSGGSRVSQERLATTIYCCSFTRSADEANLNQSIHLAQWHNSFKAVVLFEQRYLTQRQLVECSTTAVDNEAFYSCEWRPCCPATLYSW